LLEAPLSLSNNFCSTSASVQFWSKRRVSDWVGEGVGLCVCVRVVQCDYCSVCVCVCVCVVLGKVTSMCSIAWRMEWNPFTKLVSTLACMTWRDKWECVSEWRSGTHQ
jgi:hypothetical protein